MGREEGDVGRKGRPGRQGRMKGRGEKGWRKGGEEMNAKCSEGEGG